MPNLHDVAKHAGVSTATVSKVLSNTPYVSEATRRRVLKAVSDLGYRPHLAARALAAGKTRIIGVVFPHVYDALFKDPLVLAILEGIEAVVNQSDYNILLSTPRITPDGVDVNYTRLLQSGYLDGVVAIDSVPMASAAYAAQTEAIPTVVLGYHQAAYSVHCNDFRGGELLMDYLLQLGHRHIGLISVPPSMNLAVNERLRGMAEAASAFGLAFASLPMEESDFSTAGGVRAATRLLTLHPHLTALVCLNDRMAFGAIQAAQQLGYAVPQRLSVVGYDNLAMSELYPPPLTTIHQHASEMGQQAAEMLFALLHGEETSNRVLEPTLMIRESAGLPRPS